MRTLRLCLCVFVLFAVAAPVASPPEVPPVRDTYPKNPGIDMLHYAFELRLTDDSDRITGIATIDARYLEAGQSQLRLDLIKAADVLEGKPAFREALDNLGAALPLGFEITSIRQVGETGEVVSIVEWKSAKVPDGSQLAVLFRLTDGKVTEERWFVDTEQWRAAF